MAWDTHCTFQLATSVGLQPHLFYLRLTFLVGLSSQAAYSTSRKIICRPHSFRWGKGQKGGVALALPKSPPTLQKII